MDDEELKLERKKDLLNPLTRNSNSIFYGVDRISKNLLNKARKLLYIKDKVLG